MTIEETKIKFSMIKNSYSIRNYFHTDMTHQERALIGFENLVMELIKEKQELIDYLKENIEKLHNDTSGLYGSVIYGKIEAYEEILNKIEKR